jgi:anthranilate/para-aminobenzoate synthase component I
MTVRHQPEFDAFCALAAQGNLIPVYREILADLDTPVSAFLKLDDGGDAFLLESVEGGEKWARYSFLGTAPSRVLTCTGRPSRRGRRVDRSRPARRAIRWARRGRCSRRTSRWRSPVCRASRVGSSAFWGTTSCAASRACRSGRATTCTIPTTI